MIHSVWAIQVNEITGKKNWKTALGDQSEFSSWGHTHGQSKEKDLNIKLKEGLPPRSHSNKIKGEL